MTPGILIAVIRGTMTVDTMTVALLRLVTDTMTGVMMIDATTTAETGETTTGDTTGTTTAGTRLPIDPNHHQSTHKRDYHHHYRSCLLRKPVTLFLFVLSCVYIYVRFPRPSK